MSFFPNGGFFGQGAFQIDPNATPEMLDRKREMIAAMMPRFGKARYVGEGIGQLATGIATGRKNRQLDKFEGEKRSEAAGLFNQVLSGSRSGGTGGPLSILGMKPGGYQSPPPQGDKYPVGQEGPAPQGNVDPASGFDMGAPVGGGIPEDIKNGIFAGESGGDYNALFGFQNREGGKYQNVKLTDMTVDQALDFANPRGDYGQWVKGQVGRVATPMGAYQVVGTTLRAAKDALGLTGNERMTPEMQDAIGAWIYKTQGTGAWEGYKGPQSSFKPGSGVQVAQNTQDVNYGGQLNELMMMAQNPWLSPQQRQVVNSQIGQLQSQQQAVFAQNLGQQDPMYQAKLAQLNQPPQRETIKGADGRNYYMDTKELVLPDIQTPAPVPTGAFGNLDAQARAAGLQPDTAEYQEFMLNGGGDPATFRALDQQAQAAGFEPGSPEYAEFMATRGSGFAAGASQTAKNQANIQTGGAAAETVAAGKARGAASVEKGAELAEMQRNMPGLMVVVDQLEELADRATYTIAGQAADEVRKQLGQEPSESAIARSEYIAIVDNQVLPLLRETFGAAFTAKEGETLRSTLGDPNKSPAEKKAVLRAFIAQKQRSLVARGGTLPAKSEKSLPQTFEDFSANPAVQKAAEQYGVTVEDMWETQQEKSQ